MSSVNTSWLRRHPVVSLMGINVAIFVAAILIAEFAMRIYIPYNPSYYISLNSDVLVDGESREIVYPYGIININSRGFPDDEFDMSKPRRAGYFGDSVTYGVGAGHGYRFSDLLAESYPEYEHMNFAGIGLSVSEKTINQSVELAVEFDLDVALYFFNLNDIVPDTAVSAKPRKFKADASRVRRLTWGIYHSVDWLRGESYLYTWVRTVAKNFLQARGIGFHGYPAYELHPSSARSVLADTAGRISLFSKELAKKGVDFVLVILPYEMQISQEAAETYASHGIIWEEGFIEGSTQRMIIDELDPNVRHVDLYPAFVDTNDVARSRATNGVGEFFVYNLGDKLDWNHPNRSGHRAIADYLTSIDFLRRSKLSETANADRAGRGH